MILPTAWGTTLQFLHDSRLLNITVLLMQLGVNWNDTLSLDKMAPTLPSVNITSLNSYFVLLHTGKKSPSNHLQECLVYRMMTLLLFLLGHGRAGRCWSGKSHWNLQLQPWTDRKNLEQARIEIQACQQPGKQFSDQRWMLFSSVFQVLWKSYGIRLEFLQYCLKVWQGAAPEYLILEGGKRSPELKSAFQLSKTQDMYKSLVENWMIFQLCCGVLWRRQFCCWWLETKGTEQGMLYGLLTDLRRVGRKWTKKVGCKVKLSRCIGNRLQKTSGYSVMYSLEQHQLWHLIRLPWALSSQFLKTCKAGGCTASWGSVLHCLTPPPW